MLATKVVCPHCSKHLKTSKPLTVGHRVLCSRCGRSFAVRPDVLNEAAPSNAVRTPVPPTAPHPERSVVPPLPRPAGGPPTAAQIGTVPDVELVKPRPVNRNLLWAGLVVGGLLLFLGTTVGLVLYFASQKNQPETPAPAATGPDTPAEDRVAQANSSNSGTELLVPERNNPRPPPVNDHPPAPPLVRDPPPLLPSPPPPAPEPEATGSLPPDVQEQVNKAIDLGVQFLKKNQKGDGTWGGGRVGYAALPALTLLECGVPKNDIRIQKALRHVRNSLPHLNQTYDLGLAILFLDRLGDPEDKKRIQTMALRLVAGQAETGGWDYGCPLLTEQEERELLKFLEQTRPTSSLDLFVQGPNGSAPTGFLTRDSGKPLDKPSPGGSTLPLDKPSGSPPPPDRVVYKKALESLPDNLRKLPGLQPPEQSHRMLKGGRRTDNSNTQFAILGLWAASRHDIPLDRPLALVTQRFRASAAHKGGWAYEYRVPTPDNAVTPAMTGSGLLGLAVGHGLVAANSPRAGSGPLEDPAIEKGFRVLGRPIGQTRINLYEMWSMERVGVLYKRRTIDGKEWYPWGAKLLLGAQKKDGSWFAYNYPGTGPITDTCFALLFLKRANLAKDLTKKLEFFIEGKRLRDGN